MQPVSTAADSEKRCRCGNQATTACAECRHPVCGLCTRRVGDVLSCITCRSSALKLEDERRARAAAATLSSARIARLQLHGAPIRRTWIALPAAVVGLCAIMTSVAGSVLSETGAAATERRAREALGRIHDAELAVRREGSGFATLEKLAAVGILATPVVPGYQLRVDLATDAHTFWARAVPEREGLRGMILDERGTFVLDGGE